MDRRKIMLSVVERLRRTTDRLIPRQARVPGVLLPDETDPARTRFIYFELRHATSDADLAQALERNRFVTEIWVDLDGEQRVDWNFLLGVVATRANLEKVKLRDARSAERRNAPAALVRSLLQAIQQNTAIRSVELEWVRLSTDISTFVDNTSSITSFSLWGCDMESTEREQGARDLAAALQRNRNIETLRLCSLEDIYTIPILEGLRSNVSLKTFVFSPCVSFSGAAAHALQHLLESTTSIRRFELTGGNTLFHTIAHAITSSECVSELKFWRAGFHDRTSIAQLRSILQNKRNLTSLCLHRCWFGGGQQVHEDIISILSRPDSLLRCFEFDSFPLEGVPFEALLRAIEKSKLEQFKIGTIQSRRQMQKLTQSIPHMKLTELLIYYDGDRFRKVKKELLQAVKNNFTLLSVECDYVKSDYSEANLFNSNDMKTLAVYRNRNQRLDKWVDNPETVDEKVWPEALGLAQRAGPDALFRGLRSTLGSDYVSLLGERKHKHPKFCALLRRLRILRPRS